MIDRPLRIGFVGAGQMARNHLHAIRRLAVRADVVGVTDRLPGPAAAFAALAGIPSSPSIEALLTDTCPDVVHVCTPPTAHADAAAVALEHGAHVYVEKPFALTTADARTLVDLAHSRRRLVCAGHQLLRDPAFEQLVARVPALGTVVQVDSHFAFRPVGPPSARRSARALADQIVDILPHPLYTLVSVLERFGTPGRPIELSWAHGGPGDLQAVLRAGEVIGRLSVSLRARPIASSLTVTGTHGALACDFVRSTVVGAGNSGTEALEKILNPMVEGVQLVSRTTASLGRRLRAGASYPGLAELIEAFYRAVTRGDASPVSAEHLLRVSELFERLVGTVEPASSNRVRPRTTHGSPRVAVTGARGFLGAEIARALGSVRGIGRTARPDDPHVHDWIAADLSAGLPPKALTGIDVVVHAAAETAGGFDAHQRNTIDATRHLMTAMHAAGLSRLVLVSSLSVLRPPRTRRERQHEGTPRPDDPRALGPYVWGKSQQEVIVEREAAALGIVTRIIRPGALIDWDEPALPGLMGRHLFGGWHLGLGRSTVPIAVCDVRQCAEAIAWCATHFDEAPAVVNLFDPSLATRGALLARLREQGWNGRMLWLPISAVSLGMMAARTMLSLARGRFPQRLAAWSILRPRYYDPRIAASLLDAARPGAGDTALSA